MRVGDHHRPRPPGGVRSGGRPGRQRPAAPGGPGGGRPGRRRGRAGFPGSRSRRWPAARCASSWTIRWTATPCSRRPWPPVGSPSSSSGAAGSPRCSGRPWHERGPHRRPIGRRRGGEGVAAAQAQGRWPAAGPRRAGALLERRGPGGRPGGARALSRPDLPDRNPGHPGGDRRRHRHPGARPWDAATTSGRRRRGPSRLLARHGGVRRQDRRHNRALRARGRSGGGPPRPAVGGHRLRRGRRPGARRRPGHQLDRHLDNSAVGARGGHRPGGDRGGRGGPPHAHAAFDAVRRQAHPGAEPATGAAPRGVAWHLTGGPGPHLLDALPVQHLDPDRGDGGEVQPGDRGAAGRRPPHPAAHRQGAGDRPGGPGPGLRGGGLLPWYWRRVSAPTSCTAPHRWSW